MLDLIERPTLSGNSLSEDKNMKESEMHYSSLEEDLAESVDSGCVADDLVQETQCDEVTHILKSEYDYSLKILQHITGNPNKKKNLNQSETTKETKKISNYHLISEDHTESESKIRKVQQNDGEKKVSNCSNRAQSVQYPNKFEVGIPEPSTSPTNEPKLPNLSQNRLKVPCISKGEEKQKLEEELRQLRKGKGGLNKSQLKAKEKKILRKIKVLDSRLKKEKKVSNRDEKSAMAVQLGLASSLNQANKIYNQSGKLVFSKFDFSTSKKDKWNDKNNKNFDLNSFLSKLLKEKEKLKNMEEAGKEGKAVKFYESNAWKKAMMKAQGHKVKDDVEMLKKSLLKKKQQKQKSKAKWAERERKVQQSKEARQEKRKRNLEARREKKKGRNSKGKKGKRKGARIPGF